MTLNRYLSGQMSGRPTRFAAMVCTCPAVRQEDLPPKAAAATIPAAAAGWPHRMEGAPAMSDDAPSLGPDDLDPLARAARLPLSAERREAVAPGLDATLKAFDAMDAVDLGETPMNAFDPRWRR